MSLTVVPQPGGQFAVTGVTSDTAVTAPLGRVYFTAGPHTIGFDDNFAEPVIVRAYYDPAADLAVGRARARGTLDYVGYVQFMQLSFRGSAIPPDVFGGRLAERMPCLYGDDRFIDFMGPAQANANGIFTPLYPYNAMLVNGNITSFNDLCYHPLENGSIWTPQNLGSPRQSLVASLAGEICVGLVTPADLMPYLTPDNQILVLTPSPQELASSEPYRLALESLKTTPLPGRATPMLAGLDETQVAAQMIGSFVLLTLPDPENLGNTLVIGTVDSGAATSIVVNLLSDYDMEDLSGYSGRIALGRIRDYQAGTGLINSADMRSVAAPRSRGQSGLYTPAFSCQPADVILELRYWTAAVGVGSTYTGGRFRRTLSAITWRAQFQFDEDTGALTFSAVTEPQVLRTCPVESAFVAFRRARMANANASIDTSNFTLAAMSRDNFGAGTKLLRIPS